MTFQKSSFDKPAGIALNIFWSTIKKNLGITGIYSLFLLIFFPLSTLYTRLSTPIYVPHLEGGIRDPAMTVSPVTSINFSFLFVFPALFCVFIALLLFNYLHNKKATDLYHSLPVSRTALFFSKYLAGFAIVFVPLAVVLGINTLVESVFLPDFTQFRVYSLMNLGVCFLMLISLYTLTVFIVINTGTVVDAVITLLALNIGWVILATTFQSLLSNLLYGFSRDFPSYVYSVFSPLAVLFFAQTGLSGYIAIFAVVSGFALFGAVLIYKKRKSDFSGRVFSYKYMKTIIRVIASAAAGMATAVTLSMQQSTTVNAVSAFAGGFLVVSFAVYLVMYAISVRGFKGFAKSLIAYGASVGAVALIYCAVGFDIFGYQTSVPDISEIKSVSTQGNSYVSPYISSWNLTEPNNGNTYYTGESIKAFNELHRKITGWINGNYSSLFVFGRGVIGEYGDYYPEQQTDGNPQKRIDSSAQNYFLFENQINLTYHLKNGLSFTRRFNIGSAAFRDKLDEIYALREYNENNNSLYLIDASRFVQCAVGDDYSYDITALSKEQAKEVLKALREEYRASSGADESRYINPVGTLLFSSRDITYEDGYLDAFNNAANYDNYDYRFSIYPDYKNTIKLIEEYTKRSYASFPEGTKAVVTNWLTLGLWNGFNYNIADNYGTLNFNIVTDPKELRELRNSTVKYCNAEVMSSGFWAQYYYPDGTRSRLFYCWGPDTPDFFRGLKLQILPYEDMKDFISH